MKKNAVLILIIGLIILGLALSNLYLIKETFELNEQLSRIYELEAKISTLKAEHQLEINEIKTEYENQISEINEEYSEKFDTVVKTLNAFEYEIQEFYKNKFIIKEDYLENMKKINDVRAKLEDSN